MARRRQEEEEHADETWLVPYSDVLTLLLALFIVLFAVSKVDAEKFKQLSESFQAVFQGSTGVLPGERSFIPSVTPPPASAPQTMDISQPENIMSDAEINDALNAFIDAHNLQEVVAIRATSSGFSIRVLDSVAFSSGSDHLQPGSEPLLDQIAEIASKSAYYISIEGHTDDIPIAGPGNNWQLSSNRALAVLTYMQHQGVDPRRMSATGYGEYHPLLPNITTENRNLNRRVEINFISPRYIEAMHYTEPLE